GLAEMTNAGLPVPPGFTISTDVCNIYYDQNGKIPAGIDREIEDHLKRLEKAAGATLGSTENPLLVSVRSGAKFSMPGMMDTILNLGLNDDAVEGLKARTKNGRFAFDSYRRFIQMFGNVVLEIPKEAFEHEFEAVKKARGAKLDTDLDEQALRDLEQVMPKAYKQLREITTRLERHYKDVQDFEFTIQDERLFMLQTRSGKRTGFAAVVIATDFVVEKLVTPKEAILLVDPEALNQLLAPGFDPAEWAKIPAAT